MQARAGMLGLDCGKDVRELGWRGIFFETPRLRTFLNGVSTLNGVFVLLSLL